MNEISSALRGVQSLAEVANLIAAAQGQQRLVPDLTLGLLHKLNNVMTSLYFTAEGCEAELEPDHPVREMLADLTRAARDAQQLVNQTAEVNLALGSEDPEYHDLNALLVKELFLAKMLLPKAAVIATEFASESMVVRISLADFRRVLFSLALNARDAASERPQIMLQTMRESEVQTDEYSPITYPADGERIAFVFKDNGHGIAREVVERVFDPFFTTRGNRLGLGLFMAQQIAQRNGGQLVVRRYAQVGAEFAWFLPRVTE